MPRGLWTTIISSLSLLRLWLKMPQAGLDFPFEPVCDDVALPHYDPLGGHWSQPKQPEAYVKITFVQLDDGTVLGG
jgi:hypothetical protein